MGNPQWSAANPSLQIKIAAAGFNTDWASLFGLLNQGIAVVGMVVFRVLFSWLFGREFSDKTAKNLFVLPVSRGLIVAAKLIAGTRIGIR